MVLTLFAQGVQAKQDGAEDKEVDDALTGGFHGSGLLSELVEVDQEEGE